MQLMTYSAKKWTSKQSQIVSCEVLLFGMCAGVGGALKWANLVLACAANYSTFEKSRHDQGDVQR
jgi:hypothetical protein